MPAHKTCSRTALTPHRLHNTAASAVALLELGDGGSRTPGVVGVAGARRDDRRAGWSPEGQRGKQEAATGATGLLLIDSEISDSPAPLDPARPSTTSTGHLLPTSLVYLAILPTPGVLLSCAYHVAS
ncbi:unnamed protein product [Cutaneotrichosporon oleaginosum]